MKINTFPYEDFEGVPAWAVVEKAIESLVNNNDLVEKTDRRYVVGLLVKRLHEKGMLTTQAVLK